MRFRATGRTRSMLGISALIRAAPVWMAVPWCYAVPGASPGATLRLVTGEGGIVPLMTIMLAGAGARGWALSDAEWWGAVGQCRSI